MSIKINIKTTIASLIETSLLKVRASSQANSHRKISRQHKFCHGKTRISSTHRKMVMEQINNQLAEVLVQAPMTSRNQQAVVEIIT